LARATQPPPTADLTQLVKSVEDTYWPLIAYLAVVLFRRPLARLIGRIERLRGPGGLSADLTKKVGEARRAQTRQNRRNPPRAEVPSPQENASELPADIPEATDKLPSDQEP
jgi:hypothetical protein